MTDENKLLLRLKNKEQGAINDAIDIYTPYLCTVLYNLASNRLSVEDIEETVSDVFVMLWENADRIDLTKGTLRSYIAAAARNFALKRINKKRDFLSLDDIAPQGEDFADKATENDFLWDAVMRLGEPDNEIFVRYYKFGEKLRSISKVTGLNISTVKTKLSRGKRKLKRILSNAEEMR